MRKPKGTKDAGRGPTTNIVVSDTTAGTGTMSAEDTAGTDTGITARGGIWTRTTRYTWQSLASLPRRAI